MRLAAVLLYLAVEIGAFVAMTMTLGFAWAVLISIAAAVAGFAMLRWQGAKVFGSLRRAARNEVDPTAPLADTALVAGASFLLIVPGVVSTVLGMIALTPPVRHLLRPAVAAFGARRVVVAMDRAGVYATGFARGTVIDGTVVDAPAAQDPTVIDGDVMSTTGPGSGTSGDRGLPRGR
ncbi:FxsA family protein [Gordonia sp. NB41Y]|uniref:FxsA family protein n=1 Tax=Gordonia sp. NB41Y TaxID=875808 RepID=UPI0006B21EA8|nr:FxsA family protein [Gordonia sp. NB41Y]KOY49785.1 membrane protein [Gordonia sp. NB41Y]WLP90857.1 FxsA family protein [Gordonia sp. NB41Y]